MQPDQTIWHLTDNELPETEGAYKVTDLDDEQYVAEYLPEQHRFNTDFKVVHWASL